MELGDVVMPRRLGPPTLGKVVAIKGFDELATAIPEWVNEPPISLWAATYPSWRSHPVVWVQFKMAQNILTLEECKLGFRRVFQETGAHVSEKRLTWIAKKYLKRVRPIDLMPYPVEDLELCNELA